MIETAHIYGGHLEYSFAMARPSRWVKAEDYEKLRVAYEAMQPPVKATVAWLIECSYEGGRPEYYCAPAVWCSNHAHAHRFATKADAEERSAEMATIGDRSVVEHAFAAGRWKQAKGVQPTISARPYTSVPAQRESHE